MVIPHASTVLANVQLVTLTFDDYADRGQIEAFGDAIVRSTWYTSVGAEYGVNAGTQVTTVALGPAPASLTHDQIAAQIKQLITSGHVPKPAATGNQLLYMIYIPPTVTRGLGLVGVRGYHEMLKLDDTPASDSVRFPIAVVVDNGSGLAATTSQAAHQLINAVTDPYPPPLDGYYADPPMTDPWSLIRGEVADLCDGEDPFLEDGFMIPRVYSNRAAQSGKSPCTPFIPDDIWSDVSAVPSKMQIIPKGGSVTFKLTGWSSQELPDWKLQTQVANFSDLPLAAMSPELSNDMINNGVSVTLTLHAPENATSGAAGGVYVLSGEKVHPWAVGFTVQ